MLDALEQCLQSRFGFEQFLPGQRQVMEHLLAGRSAAAVFPTGAGKSLCYQLPALLLDGVTLVVSPLIALMKDQIDSLTNRGIAAARIDSTLSVEEYRSVVGQMRSGSLRMLYVAPERFQNERFREMLERTRVALFAVDEAHCISEWGHNFRPDYLKLVEFARRCRAERLLALTATATPKVLADICQSFGIQNECAVRNSSYRENLTIRTTPVDAASRDDILGERLRRRPAGPTIVYVTLQRTAEELAAKLSSRGFTARAYHAGLEDDHRSEVQDWFMQCQSGIVVATIAFGMGIDKGGIRYVYHYNLPKSLENYSQEIGRSGRDGKPATCEMFVCVEDLNQLENFAYGDTPTREAVERLVEEVFAQGPDIDVSYYELSARCDIRQLVVRTLLTYLELDGYISGGTPYYSVYRFQPLRSSQEILAEFDGERREFLEKLLRQVQKAKTWFSIDVDRAAQNLGATRDRVVRALDYLAERGWVDLRAEGTRNRYREMKSPADRLVLARQLHDRTVERERQEIARLGQVLELADRPDCQVVALCRHFGESRSQPCGHCTRCLEPTNAPRPAPRPKRIVDASIVEKAKHLRKQFPIPLSDPVAMARFLCGISSPALTRAKLTSHALFASLDGYPFGEVCSYWQADTPEPAHP